MTGGQLVHHVVISVLDDDDRTRGLRVEEQPCVVGGVAPDFNMSEPSLRVDLSKMVAKCAVVEADEPFEDHADLLSENRCLTTLDAFGLGFDPRMIASPSPPPRSAFSIASTMWE